MLELYPEFYDVFVNNLEITFVLRDEEQVGVIPRSKPLYRDPHGEFHDQQNGERRNKMTGNTYNMARINSLSHERQNSQTSEEADSLSGAGRGGILEFSTAKAGMDVTPMNLDFSKDQQRSSTLSSITGVLSHLKRSFPDLRLHKIYNNQSSQQSGMYTLQCAPGLAINLPGGDR